MVVLGTEGHKYTATHDFPLNIIIHKSPVLSSNEQLEMSNWKLKSHTIIQLDSQNTRKVVTDIMDSRAKSHQSCPTLCDPMDCSPPGSSVHGFLWARIQEWVAFSFPTDAFRKQVKTYNMTMPIWIQF